MIATLSVPGLGGASLQFQAPVRLSPPAKHHRLATEYQVQYRGVWFRVEKHAGAMYVAHAVGRIGVSISND